MARLIGVFSGKGGVGKTTLVSNLSSALTKLGRSVIAVDANLTAPHLGFHLGMHLTQKSLHDYLAGNEDINRIVYPHPAGFKFVPGSISLNDLAGVDVGRLSEVTVKLSNRADFVILDCAPSLGREAISAIQAVDEILLITTPDLPSVADVLKTSVLSKSVGKRILGVVVNRIRGAKHELATEDIENMLALPVIAEIPEDRNVAKSIAVKWPLVDYQPNSPAAVEIKRLAYHLIGKPFWPRPRVGLLRRLISWVSG
jgi:septum site-determining protein MinD